MNLEQADALLAAVLAGSLIMERLVTIAKTIAPGIFGDPGPDPERSERWAPSLAQTYVRGYRRTEWRRMWVIILVLVASAATSLALSWGEWIIHYAPNLTIHWLPFALLISGGSAFWSQVVGYVSAAKDFRAQHSDEGASKVLVVDLAHKARPE